MQNANAESQDSVTHSVVAAAAQETHSLCQLEGETSSISQTKIQRMEVLGSSCNVFQHYCENLCNGGNARELHFCSSFPYVIKEKDDRGDENKEAKGKKKKKKKSKVKEKEEKRSDRHLLSNE